MSPLFKPCFIMLCKKHTKPSSMYCLKSYCFFSSLCGLLCFKSKIYENYCPKLWNICYIYYVNLCAALPEQITTSQWLSTTRITGGIRLPPKGCKYVGRGSLGLVPFFLQYPFPYFRDRIFEIITQIQCVIAEGASRHHRGVWRIASNLGLVGGPHRN